jgi:hypothetical protein
VPLRQSQLRMPGQIQFPSPPNPHMGSVLPNNTPRMLHMSSNISAIPIYLCTYLLQADNVTMYIVRMRIDFKACRKPHAH